jgi:hypothetical protein
MKAQAELYKEFYAARQAEVAKIPHFWFGAFIKHPARASSARFLRSTPARPDADACAASPTPFDSLDAHGPPGPGGHDLP